MHGTKSFVLLTLMLFLIFSGSVRVKGRALSINASAVQPGSETTQPPSFLQEIQTQQSVLAQGPSIYSGYTEITDNEEKIKLDVPIEWSDIETGEWTHQGRSVGVFVAASTDLAGFYSNHSQAGVLIGVSRSLARSYNQEGLLGLERRDLARQCVLKGRFDYQNQFYSGQYDHFTNCSGLPGLLIVTTASADKKSLILIRIAIVSEADLKAADTILNTFQVLGDPEQDDHHNE